MKFLYSALLALGLTAVATPSFAQGEPAAYSWDAASGERFDVYGIDVFTFDFDTEDEVEDFQVIVEQHASFECDVTLEKEDGVLYITAKWTPGADLSGCEITLLNGDVNLGTTELYMNY